MSWGTEQAFEEFFQAINLPGDHREVANARKDWIIGRLRGGGLTVLDAMAMGSIPRYTALRDHADLDVLVVLHYGQHIKDRRPVNALQTVKSALGTGAGNIRRNGQAVTMKFQSWPDVDVVPASRLVDDAGAVTGFQIPDMNRDVWLDTNPPLHARDINDAVERRGPNFRRVIKMIKDWNRRQQVGLQSYHIEVIALKQEGGGWDSHSWPIFQWFETARGSVASCYHAGSNVSGYLSTSQRLVINMHLQRSADVARQAWYAASRADHRTAITHWKSIFGQRFPSYG